MNAPVLVFVYNRYNEMQETMTALANNTIASESEIYVFSDGAKDDLDKAKVEKVRKYSYELKQRSVFRNLTVIESKTNKGLADSIISGVTDMINKYGKVIVIEDDSVSAPDFLSFMNDCLNYYEKNEKIWSIGGYSCVKEIPEDYKHSVYIMGRTCSYAWATWKNRWNRVDWEVKSYQTFQYDFVKRYRFNLYGNDRATMLDKQMHGWIDSWAIRFCYAMFENSMYTVLPVSTKIRNIGMGEGGTHNKSYMPQFDVVLPQVQVKYELEDIGLNKRIVKAFAAKFHRTLKKRRKTYIDCVIKHKTRMDLCRIKKIYFNEQRKIKCCEEDKINLKMLEKYFRKNDKGILYIEDQKKEIVGIISAGDYTRHKGEVYINKKYMKFTEKPDENELYNFFDTHSRINEVPVVNDGKLLGTFVCRRG